MTAKKAEYESWKNNVFVLIDMRKENVRNFVTGRWVLTINCDMKDNFEKCKARWVLRGFQDKQKNDQQTDSPASTRPGFRMACQMAAIQGWTLTHIDLKTAFLQGEAYGNTRDVICQLPPDAGYPPYIGACLTKPTYVMNDAPRRWWNILDGSIQWYGAVPTRADRCCYVLYADTEPRERSRQKDPYRTQSSGPPVLTEKEACEDAVEYLLDPVTGSPAHGKRVVGVISIHVDDIFACGDKELEERVLRHLRKDFQVGSEDKNDVKFVGQRISWKTENMGGVDVSYICVSQESEIA